MVTHQIDPEPDEETRKAILAALAEDDAAENELSPWAQRLLPDRDEDSA
jgi:hypothetical protein